jgi:hypothetical protein
MVPYPLSDLTLGQVDSVHVLLPCQLTPALIPGQSITSVILEIRSSEYIASSQEMKARVWRKEVKFIKFASQNEKCNKLLSQKQ